MACSRKIDVIDFSLWPSCSVSAFINTDKGTSPVEIST
jgi:hypothetical protein